MHAKPTVVIVHGAWAGASSSDGVIDSLPAIAPDLERDMAKRAHADTIEINGASHSVMVSHPAAVAHQIERADRSTR